MLPLPPEHADLWRLVDQVWRPRQLEGRVTIGLAPVVDGFEAAEEHLVVPDADHARFLVPAGNRRVGAASLVRYNRLRPVSRRLPRAAIGLAVAALPARAWPSRLRVGVHRSIGSDARTELLLRNRLERELGVDGLATGLGVHPHDPNRKPTLQLFDGRGVPVGYAKLGVNPATDAMVSNEADVARRLRGRIGPVRVPMLLHAGRWQGSQVTVTAPLPPGVRGYVAPEPPPVEVTWSIAAAGRLHSAALAESAYWTATRARVDRFRAAEPSWAALMGSVVTRLSAMPAEPLRYGAWHGDWVPWNLAEAGSHLFAWDWEHAGFDVPLGFDLVHWYFQQAVVLRHGSAADGVAAATGQAVPALRALGYTGAGTALVTRLYLLEMYLRTHDLQRAGGSWNEVLHPHLLTALAATLADGDRSAVPGLGCNNSL